MRPQMQVRASNGLHGVGRSTSSSIVPARLDDSEPNDHEDDTQDRQDDSDQHSNHQALLLLPEQTQLHRKRHTRYRRSFRSLEPLVVTHSNNFYINSIQINPFLPL